ncbi:response regulator transcription factor [Actinoplanes bogorensis]|uniref:Response regulator transcription factor n=1 Tax=Paractinoplanes bogorensis TaxID=1610840 RepID=A0ABS5YVP5_9ACTN|nr:response regulator transcription factor [Actinoplanes bogorensis]MBU2667146.1 response regulator transcription factor [Actinoplanes bogorensis]
MITVLLADDQSLIRAGIAMLLTAQPDLDVVAEADDGRQAVNLCAVHRPDVVVMDLQMPVMNGIEATRRLLSPAAGDTYRPRILILTNFHDNDNVHEALRAGAAGFLIKDSSPAELPAGIRTVAAGHHYLHPVVTGGVIASITAQPTAGQPLPGILDRLTPREREILRHMAYGLGNGEIAVRLFLSEATVRTHVSRILMKLGVHDRAQAIVVAYQNHLVRPPRTSEGEAAPSDQQ